MSELKIITNLESQVLKALIANIESRSTGQDGSNWGCVYLDNASSDANISGSKFSGILGSLQKKGLYREDDHFFGHVLINAGTILED